MSTQRLAAAVALTGVAGVLAGVAAAAGALEPDALVTAALGVGLVYVATGAAGIAIDRSDRRTLAAPVALAVGVGVVATATQRLLVWSATETDVLLGRSVVGLGSPASWPGGGLTFGALAVALGLAFPLGLSWRRRHRWLLCGLALATAVPLVATFAQALTSAESAGAEPVLAGVAVGGVVLLAGQPLFVLGRRLRRHGWSGVATVPLLGVVVAASALQVLGVVVAIVVAPATVLSAGTLSHLLLALGAVLLLAAHGYVAATRRRTPPSARG